MIRKIFALTAVVAMLFISAYSQNSNSLQQSKIDSIKNVVDLKNVLEAFDPLVALAIKQAETDNVTALETVTRANQLAIQSGDSAKMTRSGRMIGQLLNKLGRHKEVISVLTRYYPIARRNNNRAEIPKILNNLAIAYTVQADYEKALDINFQTLILREAENDKTEISISLNNIGFVYFKLKNYSKALDFFDRALKAKNASNDTYDLDRLHMNIGLCYNQLNKPDQAMKAFQEGFKVCGDKCSDETVIEGEFGLGMSYLSQKKYTVAKFHFNKSRALAIQVGNLRFVAENCVTLGRVYVRELKRDSSFLYSYAKAKLLRLKKDTMKFSSKLIRSFHASISRPTILRTRQYTRRGMLL